MQGSAWEKRAEKNRATQPSADKRRTYLRCNCEAHAGGIVTQETTRWLRRGAQVLAQPQEGADSSDKLGAGKRRTSAGKRRKLHRNAGKRRSSAEKRKKFQRSADLSSIAELLATGAARNLR